MGKIVEDVFSKGFKKVNENDALSSCLSLFKKEMAPVLAVFDNDDTYKGIISSKWILRSSLDSSETKVKTLIKKVMDSKEKETAEVKLKEAVAFLDRTAIKGRMHKNNVARKKSKLTKFVNGLEAK